MLYRVFSVIFICVVFILPSKQAQSAEISNYLGAASIEYMMGSGDLHGVRAAIRLPFYHELDMPWIGPINVEYELSANVFDIHGSSNNEATYGASFSPVLVKRIAEWRNHYPIDLEVGIGVAYVHDERFGGTDIGSSYQFEDRIGLSMKLGEDSNAEIGLRYVHYSNGGFNTKNPGLDFLSFLYLQRF
ncbi:acyloxyacyl hydrolase [Glaciecola sp. 1036]|uniref:acyloxyacyl hydrolase n=1 Tax=Alteromonadaceae TaxID=72275 RepID=UPI003D070D0E